MAEIIDREKLINDGISKGFCDWYTEIKNAPKVEIEERKVGKWITNSDFPDRLICSCCDIKFDMWVWEQKNMHYCPNCGAEMRGTENG